MAEGERQNAASPRSLTEAGRIRLMRTVLFVVAALTAVSAQGTGPAPRAYFTEPAISPDGVEIAFVSGGDIWTVPAGGGEARLLVSHPANESAAALLARRQAARVRLQPHRQRRHLRPDLRDRRGDAAHLRRRQRAARRLVARRRVALLLLDEPRHRRHERRVSRARRPAARRCRWPPIATSTSTSPRRRRTDATIAITARGDRVGQWWRNGHSHIDESGDLAARATADDAALRARSRAAAPRSMWPMWAPDGTRALLRVRSRRRAEHVDDAAAPAATPQQLTHVHERPRALAVHRRTTAGRSSSSATSASGRLDIASGQRARCRSPCAARRPAPASSTCRSPTDFTELALSPDGKKVAFVVRGEVFAAAREGRRRRGARQPHAAGRVAARLGAGQPAARLHLRPRRAPATCTSTTSPPATETRLTSGADADHSPRFSPDGKLLAFMRGGRELRVLDVASEASERVVATGMLRAAAVRRRARRSPGRRTASGWRISSTGAKAVHQRLRRARRRRRRRGR